MPPSKIDLNLFQIFITIYDEGNLTRAGEALHLTQPAVSHSLARLRDAFGDPLFVRKGTKMEPTPVSRGMIEQVRASVVSLQSTLQPQQHYDHANSSRTFRLCLRDITEAACLPPLLEFLQNNAPDVRVVSQRVERKRIERLLTSGKLDFAMDVFVSFGKQIEHQHYKRDNLVVVARKQHPALSNGLSREAYFAGKHILVSTRPEGPGFEDTELSRMGLSRHIGLRCQHYLVASQTVQKTDYLLTMPESYARVINQPLANEIFPLPVELAAIDVYLYWHRQTTSDPGSTWMRELLLSLA